MPGKDFHNESSSRYLKELFMQAPVSFSLLCGKDLIIKMVNRRALEFSGKNREEVINRPFFEVYPELAEQGFKKITQDVFISGFPFRATELPIRLLSRKKTETEYINLTLEPLKNHSGIITGVIGVATDVSMLVRSRNSVRESEEKYRGILESMNQGFCMLEILVDENNVPFNYKYLEVNPAFEAITGLKDIIGKTALDIMPEFADFWINEIGEVALNGESKTISGDAGKWYESFAFKLGGTNSMRVGLLFSDATERKAEEEQILQYSEKLKAEVEERTRALLESNRELLHFTYVTSHDLREPVRKIETFTRRLIHEHGTLPAEKKKTFLERILNAVDRLKHIIDGVLAYSSIESTHHEFEIVDLAEVVGSIIMHINTPNTKRASFEVESLPVIEGSKHLLYQLFHNLIHNSVKFSRSDCPLTISISSKVLSRGNREFITIIIKDTGIGFNPEYKEKIFQSFIRLHAKDDYEGSGMGLAVCRKIVEKHGGTISAAGEENKGASFRIELPLKQTR